MSHVDLDEIPTDALMHELVARSKDRREGKCDYCHRYLGSRPYCRFPERHLPSPGDAMRERKLNRLGALLEEIEDLRKRVIR